MSNFAQDYSEYDGPSNDWGSPPSVVRPFDNVVGGFDLDPCSGAEAEPLADDTFTVGDDGLSKDWFGQVWCNPPYSDPGPWLDKAVKEVQLGNADRVLLLLPARVHTNWFQEQLHGISAVLFFNRKVKFLRDGEVAPAPAPFTCMLVVVGPLTDELVRACERQGWLVKAEDRIETTEQMGLSDLSGDDTFDKSSNQT